jgi:exosortase
MVGSAGLTRLHLILMALGFAPLLVLFFGSLWIRPHYQFFPMALAGAGFLAWTRCQSVPRPLKAGTPRLTAFLLGMSWLLLVIATMLWTPWLASVAAVLMLVGVIWWLGERTLLRACIPALVLLVAIIPPPLNLDSDLTLHLRALAVFCSGCLLDFLGVILATSGNIIEFPGRKLLVEEACSGINSVMFALVACLFYTLWQRRSPRRVFLSLCATLAFVIMGNVFRITLGAWLLFKFKWNLLEGWPHETLGLALTISYLGLIYSLDRALTFLGAPIFEATPPPAIALAAPAATEPVSISPGWGWAAATAFVLLGVVAAGWGWPRHFQGNPEFVMTSPSKLRAGASFAMPDAINDWHRLDADVPALYKIETTGISSHVWHYQKGNLVVTLALDYPFRGFHDVSICYKGAGWIIEEHGPAGGFGTNSPVRMEMVMTKDGVERGYLWYGTVDEQGTWLALSTSAVGRLGARFAAPIGNAATTYRVQVLTTRYAALSPSQQQQAWQFFEAARSQLWQQLAGQFKHGP